MDRVELSAGDRPNESESTAYDPSGEVDYTIDFNGAKVDSIYDYESGSGLRTKFGRLARLDLYEPLGTKVETVEYGYDELGRIDTVTEGLEVRGTDTDFDAEGRTVRIGSPEGEIVYGRGDELVLRTTCLAFSSHPG